MRSRSSTSVFWRGFSGAAACVIKPDDGSMDGRGGSPGPGDGGGGDGGVIEPVEPDPLLLLPGASALLVGSAGLGAGLSHVITAAFTARAGALGLHSASLAEAAHRVLSGDLTALLAAAPASLHEPLRAASHAAASHAAAFATLAAFATAALVRASDTAPARLSAPVAVME